MATGGHFGGQKFIFISHHFFLRWPLVAILDVRNSFSIKVQLSFLATLSETIQQWQSAAHLVRCKI
jgi:hypothetical protein